MRTIYLDYAAATPVSHNVLRAAQPYFSDVFANPSSVYASGQQAKQALEQARTRIARNLGVASQTITFTAGATESIELAVQGIMLGHPGAHIISSHIEHEAVLQAINTYEHSLVAPDKNGVVGADQLRLAITEHTVMVSVMYANNEIGTVQPLSDIAKMIRRVRAERAARGIALPLYLHTDASQAANYLHLNIARLGVDLLTLNGGKTYGFKQSGALYASDSVKLAPFIRGGGQEHGLRGGTENVAQSVGLAEAIEYAQAHRKQESTRVRSLRNALQAELLSAFPNMTINGHRKRRLANNLSMTLPGLDGERAVMALDEVGIAVATGSACSASNDEPSHVLLSIGLSEAEASATLRITLGRHTTEEDMHEATAGIIRTLKRIINQN